MKAQSFDPLIQEFHLLYNTEGISVTLKDLKEIVSKAQKSAVENYKKLKPPKLIPIDTYARLWVREALAHDLAKKTVKPVKLDKPPIDYKAIVDFHLILPPELLHKVSRKILHTSPERGEEVWNSFNLPFKEIEEKFIAATVSKNKMAQRKGFKSFLEYQMFRYKISTADYINFERNINKAVDFCTNKLSNINTPQSFFSEFSIPCYMCLLLSFPFKDLDETFDFIAKKYKVLDKFKKKIKIRFGESSTSLYKKETDSFEIVIDRHANIRHQVTDLTHELCHVLNNIESFQKGFLPAESSAHIREKEATVLELDILKQLSADLHQAIIGQFLQVFCRILFEIEIYKNPNQDLSKLYAETFNRCYKGANQKKNRTYILDEKIILRPLISLPHALANVDICLSSSLAK